MAQSVAIGPATGGAGASLLQVLLTFTGNLVSGSAILSPQTVTNANSIQAVQSITLAAATFLAVSTQLPLQSVAAAGVVIVMPTANANAVILKGVTGDTGIAMCPNGITVLTFPAVNSVVPWGMLSATGVVGILVYWF